MLTHLVNTQCFHTYLLAIPEVFGDFFAPGVAGRVIHNVIAAADRAVGLLQTATLGIAGCCQVQVATRQSTKGDTGAVSGETLNSIFQQEMGRAREGEGEMVGNAVDPQVA